MIDALAYLLLIISSALLYPVMILLVLLTIAALFFAGELLAEYSTRRGGADIVEGRLDGSTWLIERFRRDIERIKGRKMLEVRLEKLLQEYEFEVERRLEPLALSAKLAPVLGLMGTLIPLGPALIGLTRGDINMLAENLAIAFTTTVVGLFAASICYVALSLRRRWYAQDISDIAFYAELIAGGGDGRE